MGPTAVSDCSPHPHMHSTMLSTLTTCLLFVLLPLLCCAWLSVTTSSPPIHAHNKKTQAMCRVWVVQVQPQPHGRRHRLQRWLVLLLQWAGGAGPPGPTGLQEVQGGMALDATGGTHGLLHG
jgi:hypothetical protein